MSVVFTPKGAGLGVRPGSARAAHGESQAVRVLVVDPDESARSVLRAALATEGFEVLSVGNSAEARRYLTPALPPPDVVVVEAELAGEDGFAFCGRLRSDPRTANLAIILLSKRYEGVEPELADGVGADDYLPKPIFVRDVVSLIKARVAPRTSDGAVDLTTSQLSLALLLRALLAGVRSGRIELREHRGHVTFRQGKVIDASFEQLRGLEALHRLLLLASGEYRVRFGPALGRASFVYGLRELMAHAFPQMLKWERLLLRSLPLEACLVVEFSTLGRHMGTLPEGVGELARLFDGHRTVREVLVESPLGEVTSLEAITKLYTMGILAPAEFPAAKPTPAPVRAEGAFQVRSAVAGKPTSDVRALEQRLFGDLEKDPSVGVPPGMTPLVRKQLQALPDSRAPEAARPIALTDVVLAHQVPAELPEVEARFFEASDPFLEPLDQEDTERVVLPAERRALRAAGVVFVVALLACGVALVSWRLAGGAKVDPEVAWPIVALPPGPAPVRLVEPPSVEPSAAKSPPVEPLVEATPPAAPVPTAEPPGARSELQQAEALYLAGRPREAALLLSRVVEAQPTDARSWLLLGLSRYDSGARGAAEEAARKALELDPKGGRTLILLATICLDRGQRREAEGHLRRYLELEPNGPHARDARLLLR